MDSSTDEVSAFIMQSILPSWGPSLQRWGFSRDTVFKAWHYRQSSGTKLLLHMPWESWEKQDPQCQQECRAAGDCCWDGSKLQISQENWQFLRELSPWLSHSTLRNLTAATTTICAKTQSYQKTHTSLRHYNLNLKTNMTGRKTHHWLLLWCIIH